MNVALKNSKKPLLQQNFIQQNFISDHIVEIILNNPANRNALSFAMMESLNSCFLSLADNSSCRCVILSSSGSCFSAGHDLKEISSSRGNSDLGREFFTKLFRSCVTLMENMVSLNFPIIACVDGSAVAAGCQLVASCDLVVASKNARFCTPGVNIGLFCSTPMVALSRSMPRKKVMEMLLLGDFIDADTALQYGLVNRVVQSSALYKTAIDLAEKIVSKPSKTVSYGKKAFYKQCEMDLSSAYNFTADLMVENALAADSKEGISAFLCKRTAKWSS